MSGSERHSACDPQDLLDRFGRIDIYLFDQLLKGRIHAGMRILDAGCGGGRNARHLMRCGASLYGIDSDKARLKGIVEMAAEVAPELPEENFRVADVESLPFPDDHFDAVISSAVLHFARDRSHCDAMISEMWRTLRTGGVLFARLASTIGIEQWVESRERDQFRLPDGTVRFLVDQDYLLQTTDALGGFLLEPIKTTNVQNQRAMTTWVVEKRSRTSA